MAVKKSDLYSSLWASCDELRGGMDASQYKDYVLFMLFIKYVSDKYGDSDDFEPPIRIPKGASFKDMVALKGSPEIGDRINTQVIQPLVDANTMLARTDFPDFDNSDKLGEGSDKVDRLERLIAIFQNPNLDFSGNRAENDDILGDAYEYLMRHFATESGKSKGQFYTPSEVSRVIAKVIGISPKNTVGSTTAYDPTCGSGSLLLKVAAEAGKRITLEGQEKDVTTAGLARMNMILHDFPTAKIVSGNTLTQPKFLENDRLRTYDYVVANPPFSDKAWSTGFEFDGEGVKDKFTRFSFGTPPAKQGDYAYLLHIIRSMKSTGKAACILPHGVLFRGNAEAVIREALVRSGILKGIIGLPANLFFGTGIPACILVLDKENATARKGVFMIDASKGRIKDGAKNRLREQDVHKIVDAFTKGTEISRYSRAVPFDEIADPKNAFNLNLPRYIDASDPEDLQDIDAHLRGGLPGRDIDALAPYWAVMPNLRDALFAPGDRAGYHQMRLPQAEVKHAILNHPEFRAFTDTATQIFETWRTRTTPKLLAFGLGGHPKDLIHDISEDLLGAFRTAPLVGAYDTYQHLMDYWRDAMQDDCYLISASGWVAGVQPREILQIRVKAKQGGGKDKLVWPEAHDYLIGRRRFKSDLIPATLMIAAFFAAEQAAIDNLDARIAELEQQLADKLEDGAGEDGLLAEVIEGMGDKADISARAIKARLKDIGRDAAFAEERAALKEYLALIEALANAKAKRKAAEIALYQLVHAKYGALTEDQVKDLTTRAKWLARVDADTQGEVARVSQTLTGRVRTLAERYATPLPDLEKDVAALAARVAGHLRSMGLAW
jgi:type I restriction enzyme M protein